MRLHHIALSLCATAALTAADPVMVDLSLPDLQRSQQRLRDGLYGQVWFAPETAALRQHLDALALERGSEIRVDLQALVAALTGAELAIGQPMDDDPPLLLQLRGAEAVGPLVQLLEEQGVATIEPGQRGLQHESHMAVAEDRLLVGLAGAQLDPLPVPSVDHDLLLRWHPEVIIAALAAQAGAREAAAVALVENLLPAGELTASFTAAGVAQRLELTQAPAGLAPVDRTVLATLPAEPLALYAVGIDGAAWWTAHGDAVMNVVAQEMTRGDRAAADEQLTAMVGALGIQGGIGGLAASLQGTAVTVVHGSGGLMPGISIAIPRSAGLDTMITLGMGMGGMLMPAEGRTRFLVLRGMGDRGQDLVPGVAVGRDAGHWWISTDPVFLAGHLAGEGGGWTEGAMGRAVLAGAAPEASVIGGADAKALLRSLVPLATIGGSFLDQAQHAEALGQAMIRLARRAGYDRVVGQPTGDGWTLTIEGAVAGMSYASSAQIAVIAAIAIPNLLESRITAQESAAASTLRSGVFTGQEVYRASAHNDRDNDNKGEYGFLPQLSGQVDTFGSEQFGVTPAGNIELLGADFTGPDAVINGYHYQVWLDDGQGGALDYEGYLAKLDQLDQAGINSNEIYYVCYAWPEVPGEDGRWVYVMTNGGTVLQAPVDAIALPPAWDALKPGATQFREFRNPAQPWTPR